MQRLAHFLKGTPLAGLLLALAILPARAENAAIQIDVSTAKVLKFDRTIRDVIAGDKDIADVAVEGARTLVVTGKKEGKTNVIVYDVNNDEIYSAQIIVGPRYLVWIVPKSGAGKAATLTSSSTWDCAPDKLCNFVKESETVLPTQVTKGTQKIDQNVNQNVSGPAPSGSAPLTQ
jgi:hypothetical protein